MNPHEAFWRALTLGSAEADPRLFLEALLAHSSLSEDDRSFLREQGPARLVVYRRLVRNNLREVIELAMPRTARRLDDLDGREPGRSSFAEAFDAFCRERGPRSHYLRDVAFEFLDHCERFFSGVPAFPCYLLELGRLEAAEIEIAATPSKRELRADDAPQSRPSATAGSALELELGAAFIDACRLFSFEHAVHRLPSDLDDRTVPEPSATRLLVYRSPEHEVRYLELSAVAAAIVKRLLDGESLRLAIVEGAAETGAPVDDAVLAGSARVLADLAERGVLLGAREPAR